MPPSQIIISLTAKFSSFLEARIKAGIFNFYDLYLRKMGMLSIEYCFLLLSGPGTCISPVSSGYGRHTRKPRRLRPGRCAGTAARKLVGY
jgi:hypothetical protein